MRLLILLLVFCGCASQPIRSITYDPDIVWDHDQSRICQFTVNDRRLNCLDGNGGRHVIMEAISISVPTLPKK